MATILRPSGPRSGVPVGQVCPTRLKIPKLCPCLGQPAGCKWWLRRLRLSILLLQKRPNKANNGFVTHAVAPYGCLRWGLHRIGTDWSKS
eukprot:93476-Chlamydomonas_euryale.AAC.5